MSMRTTIFCLILCQAAGAARAAEADASALTERFDGAIAPFLKTYCLDCHAGAKPKGDLDLSVYTSVSAVAKAPAQWEAIVDQLEDAAMPPAKAKRQPDAALRRDVVAWIRDFRRAEARRNAGDPGPVSARRLSNAEYDHTIRDLTGVDMRPTQEFPVDPANEAGFDNSAESLSMSPALVKKYLEAARRVSEHAVLTPQGIAFAAHPVVADTDRDKYCVRRIIAFYQRQPVDLADYVFAAWRFQHRAALGQAKASLESIAAESRLSPRYLATIWSVLSAPAEPAGPIAALQSMWSELDAPGGSPDAVRAGCARMRDAAVQLRAQLVPSVENLTAPGINNGSQCFVLWKNREMALNRRHYVGDARMLDVPDVLRDTAAAGALDELISPETLDQFCRVVPDAFFVSERARVYLDPKKEKQNSGRLLSAGFHSMTGFFRDDDPLYELILGPEERRELDTLWQELDFVANAPARQYASFLWFERTDSRYMRDPEFDFARAEDKDAASAANIAKLAEVYIAKARRTGAEDLALEAMADHFRIISASLRAVERARAAAVPRHVEAVQAFAERAYRRPLTNHERDRIAAFYRGLRDGNGLTHEESVRDTLASVLMSPHVCYRVDLPGAPAGIRPLPDYALASRLSYFLWSSMPDEALRRRAASGELHRTEVLAAEARRMLGDAKVRGLATEFAGNWLDFRRFEEHNSVDRGRFPSFDDALRSAMFEEPVRFFVDLVQHDRSVLAFVDGRHTFVNAALARHYGMPEPAEEWARVDDADRFGRGGLLPMAAFLTKNSPGLRTSPVKRGYWVARRLLGEDIPAPPAEVPELPGDEAKLGELTLRQTLARHRADKSCAGCHARFDPIGLAFEGYGPVGERRDVDLGGRPVDTRAEFPRGGEGQGLEGLKTYLRERRQDEFVENLCRKLLAYGLGRSLLPSDDETLSAMRSRLAAEGYRFSTLVETIVASPQFRNKRIERAEAEE